MKTIHCKEIHFLKTVSRDIIQCNCLFHLFKYSFCESSMNFHEFFIMPIRNISRDEKKKRNTTLRRNTNEMKALNMKLTKPKTFRGEMSF